MKKLNLFGPVYPDKDCVNVSAVADFISTLESGERFEVFMNSPGGSVFEGLAIYNLLLPYAKQSTFRIIGEASSIMSVIACASNDVRIADTAVMLIHNPWTFAIVDEEYIKKLQKSLNTIKQSILQVYEKKTGKSREELNELMKESDYHDAKTCVKIGLADSVYNPSEDEKQTINESNKLKNELSNKYMVLNIAHELVNENSNINNIEETKMDIEKYQNRIDSLEAKLAEVKMQSEQQVQKYENTIAEMQKQSDILNETIKQLELKNSALENANADTLQNLWAAEETSYCEALVQEGKLTRAEYIGNSADGERPAKVSKLLKLRNLDDELYRLERKELESRKSINALTEPFRNESASSADLDILMASAAKFGGK